MLSGKWPTWKSSNLYSGLYWPVVTKPYACLADVFQNFPEYLQGFQSLPNFSIYEADAYFLGTVIFAVSCGIFAFLVLCIVIANIFRMLSLLKTQISASNYQKHRAAVWSLLAQFATSGVCFIPPLALVFVALFSINRGQCRFILPIHASDIKTFSNRRVSPGYRLFSLLTQCLDAHCHVPAISEVCVITC